MKQISKSKHRCTAGFFKTTALGALLASTLVATTAEAAVLISRLQREIGASATGNGIVQDVSATLNGPFDSTVSSVFGSFSASATQNSSASNDSQVFRGSGSSSLVGTTNPNAVAFSTFLVAFELTGSYTLSGFATLRAQESNNADINFANASFSLVSQSLAQEVFSGFGTEINFSFEDTTIPAGKYLLDFNAPLFGIFSGSPGSVDSSSSSFDFLFALTEVIDTPPNSVPEPGSLALAMAGLAAIAAARKKKATNEGDLETRHQGRKDARAVADSFRQNPRMSDIDSRDVFVD